jgi:hypothetical protein
MVRGFIELWEFNLVFRCDCMCLDCGVIEVDGGAD